MKRRNVKDWLFNAMPAGEWVTIEWAEAAVKKEFKSGFSFPASLLHMLVGEGKVQPRRIHRRRNRLISEFRKIESRD